MDKYTQILGIRVKICIKYTLYRLVKMLELLIICKWILKKRILKGTGIDTWQEVILGLPKATGYLWVPLRRQQVTKTVVVIFTKKGLVNCLCLLASCRKSVKIIIIVSWCFAVCCHSWWCVDSLQAKLRLLRMCRSSTWQRPQTPVSLISSNN